MSKNWHVSNNEAELAKNFADWFMHYINNHPADIVHVALSGGNTPIKLYQTLSSPKNHYVNAINWGKIFFFFGDERCVPKSDPQSNYGKAFEYLFDKVDLDTNQVFRIKGEINPEEEVERYSNLLYNLLPKYNSSPQFDLILLGIGDDGHTASIFPDQMELINSGNICEIGIHPVLQQKRVTLSGRTLNNAHSIAFLVTGSNKKEILHNVYYNTKQSKSYPVTYINKPQRIEWFVDKKAASLINDLK